MAKWDILIVREGRHQYGVEEADVRRMLSDGTLQVEDCLRRAGEERWRRVAELKDKNKQATGAVVAPAAAPVERGDGDSWDAIPDENGAAAPPRAPRAKAAAAMPPRRDEPNVDHDDDDEGVYLGRKTEIEPLDMTPMVDVVLLLLLFFMVTASYSMQKSIEIPTPSEKKTTTTQSKADLKREYIFCEILGDNSVLVDDDPIGGLKPVDAIRRCSDETKKNKVIVVADGDSTNEYAVRVIDAARAAGMESILYAVKSE